MLETRKPPGWRRIAASFFSATFVNPSMVSAYILDSLLYWLKAWPSGELSQTPCHLRRRRHSGARHEIFAPGRCKTTVETRRYSRKRDRPHRIEERQTPIGARAALHFKASGRVFA